MTETKPTDNLDAGMGKDIVERLTKAVDDVRRTTFGKYYIAEGSNLTFKEVADLFEETANALRRPPDVVVLREALEFCIEHLEEMRKDPKWHPIGHCPVLDKARQALAGAGEVVPAGWKLVPVEPTIEMIRAGVESYMREPAITLAEASYRAMLSTSPARTSEKPSGYIDPDNGQYVDHAPTAGEVVDRNAVVETDDFKLIDPDHEAMVQQLCSMSVSHPHFGTAKIAAALATLVKDNSDLRHDLDRTYKALTAEVNAAPVVETPELVEKVARAIYEEKIAFNSALQGYRWVAWEQLDEDAKDEDRYLARAAIRAMLSSAPSAAEGDQK